MAEWVCAGRDGLFVASEELAEVLDSVPPIPGKPGSAWRVEIGFTCTGRRFAATGGWRVVVNGDGYGEYDREWQVVLGLPVFERTSNMPAAVEAALCFALQIAVARPWTVEEILAREG